MNIENLRRKHKKTLVDQAFVIYGIAPKDNSRKTEWVNYLIAGGKLELMLEKLKSGGGAMVDDKSKLLGRTARIYVDLVSAMRRSMAN